MFAMAGPGPNKLLFFVPQCSQYFPSVLDNSKGHVRLKSSQGEALLWLLSFVWVG